MSESSMSTSQQATQPEQPAPAVADARMRVAVAFATATFVLVVGVLSLFIAVLMFGLGGQVQLDFTSAEGPGALAIITAAIAAWRVKTWKQWRSWLPGLAMITFVLAVVLMAVIWIGLWMQGQPPNSAEQESAAAPTAEDCIAAQQAVIRAGDELLADYDEKLERAAYFATTDQSSSRPGPALPSWVVAPDSTLLSRYEFAYRNAADVCG